MSKYKALLDATSQVGRVERLGVRPERKATVVELTRWTPGEQDHGKVDSKRAVTLIQAEHLPAIAAILDRPVDALSLRRNVVVSGINLASLIGRRFQIGELTLEGTELCEPCMALEEILGPGGYAATIGMGGICAKILEPGSIEVGAEVCALS